MPTDQKLEPIPQPKPVPVLRNIPDMDGERPIQGMMNLARTYGPIFRLSFPERDLIVVSSRELVHELCDEKRFDKKVQGALEHIRDFAGDGLFTAHTQEPNWAKAHRLLVPAFGPLAIRDMFPQMLDVAEQLVLKWERLGERASLDVPDHMTRLTLDTIALCAFDYRFNSFYQNEMHPFVGAMVRALAEAGARQRRLPMQTKLMLQVQRQYGADIKHMHGVAKALIDERRANPELAAKRDLLGIMMTGKDPVTGEGLSDENILYQLVTFLIAGHETTSGLLSFALYGLLKNPGVLTRAREEVERVLGNATPRMEHLAKLTYVDQVLKEALRLWPTAPGFMVVPYVDTVIGGKYAIKKSEAAFVLLPMLHRDPKVWGGDPETFDPDRFDPAAFAALPADAWRPFGNGQRACIGRPFAMQEATLVLAMILQRFDLFEADPAYQLDIKETLTLKPHDFAIRVRRRGTTIQPPGAKAASPAVKAPAAPTTSPGTGGKTPRSTATPLLVVYGSNSGSAEAFARRIAGEAVSQGFAASVAPMDERAGHLRTDGALLVVTASYEGQPPDNAKQFVAWLETLAPGSLKGLRFAVFGCGNRDWAQTYQAVPKLVDQRLEAAGAARIIDRGEADARGDFFGDFDAWYEALMPKLRSAFGKTAEDAGVTPLYQIEVVKETRSVLLRLADLQPGEIVENRELVDMSKPLGRSKRHIEIALPPGMTYRAGDYLAVLPANPRELVERSLKRFGLHLDSRVIIRMSRPGQTTLPTDQPINVIEILASYVELAQPATKRQIEALAAASPCPPEAAKLSALTADDVYKQEVLAKRVSVLDLLEQFAACTLDFGAFLEMLPPMRVRQYSISSSPLWNAGRCSVTAALVKAPAWSGRGEFKGVASNYLGNASVGTKVAVATRPSNAAFHLPGDPETPVIMVAAGTGLAPFRGFVQERAAQVVSGRRVGPALLFFGCDHPDVDRLYQAEFAAWEKAGVVSVRPAFSEAPEGDVRFVQHRVWRDRADIVALVAKGAHIFVCGDGLRMAPAVRETFVRIYHEWARCTVEEAEAWAHEFERQRGRYSADVFS